MSKPFKFTVEKDSLDELKPYFQAESAAAALWDISQAFRSQMKYTDDNKEHELFDSFRHEFYQILEDRDVTLD